MRATLRQAQGERARWARGEGRLARDGVLLVGNLVCCGRRFFAALRMTVEGRRATDMRADEQAGHRAAALDSGGGHT